ncbi:unnamed protein product, partial [Rotaria sp. Silwood2]
DLVQQAKIPTRTVSIRDMKIFNMINPNIAKNLKIWFDEYMNYVEEATKTSSRNQSLQQYAEIFFTMKNFTNELQDAFYSYVRTVIEVNEGTEISTINAKDFVEIAGSFYGLDKVCHDTGYHSMIDNIVKDFRDDDIRFGQIVNKINYDNDLVEVQTVNGHVYRSQSVLITVPLGVLKGRQIMFNPTLPQWKLNSIDRIGNGLLNKVVLVWDKAWWNSTNYFLRYHTPKPSRFSNRNNPNKWNDRPSLISLVMGNEANRIETLTNEQVVNEVLNELQKMFPNQSIPMPIESFVTRRKSDPFSNGSYSYISQYQTYEDMIYISKPIADKLLFAGEATAQEWYGYAHGALLSA